MTSIYRNTNQISKIALTFMLWLMCSYVQATVCDADNNNVIDRNDINLIIGSLGQQPNSGDSRDFNADGKISIYDARRCVLSCNLKSCATPETTNPVDIDLSDPDVFHQQIIALPGVNYLGSVDYLQGEWTSTFNNKTIPHGEGPIDTISQFGFNGNMVDEKFTFNADGSFQLKQVFYKHKFIKTGSKAEHNGEWGVFTVANSSWNYLLLKYDTGGIFYYPIEQDGHDAVRFIMPNQKKMYANAQLFIRLKPNSKTSVFPGRALLGSYQTRNSLHKFVFETPNNFTQYSKATQNSDFQKSDEGTWELSPNNLTLYYSSSNEESKYEIHTFDYQTLIVEDVDNGGFIAFDKLADTIKNYGTDLFTGEFQNGGGILDGTDRMSIKRLSGGQYSIDIHSTQSYTQLPGKILGGLLYVDTPGGDEFEFVLKPIFNGLRLVSDRSIFKGPRVARGYEPGAKLGKKRIFERVSHTPLPEITDVEGWWRAENSHIKLLSDGQFIANLPAFSFTDYGTYSVIGSEIIFDPICGAPKKADARVSNNQLFSSNPVPGMKELGEVGGDILFLARKHFDDKRKAQTPLKPHPTISDAYVVTANTSFGVGRSLVLKPNGFASKIFAVPVDSIDVGSKDVAVFESILTYRIVIREDKEYIVLKETGEYINLLADGTLGRGVDASTIPERDTLLYNGRMSICFKYGQFSAESSYWKR